MAERNRMTWEDICKAYPNQRVALSEVEWVSDPGFIVKSGIVQGAEQDGYSRMEIRGMAARSGGKVYCCSTHRGASDVVHVGMTQV